MTERRIDGFFYGLFMDKDILGGSQIVPANPRRAFVDGYALRIGRRATLIPTSDARAYGMVFALTHKELERLYTAPGLEQYRAEAILAQILEGGALPALCYNLLEAPGPDETNSDYATRLRTALRRLNFPSAYVESIS